MKFMLGANYWGREHATNMWRHYDGEKIREEMKLLAEYGVRCLRVFPNWRDFQPVDTAYCWGGNFGEYINSNTGKPVYDDGVDIDRIEDFRDFCHAAEEYGITLVVSIVTGWMSGRLFFPPCLTRKNLITDPEVHMWMRKFIHRFVRELKNEKAIVMWDLGNECNCMGTISNSFEAYMWTAIVRDAILLEDTTRPISSGMHELKDNAWKIEHQGELCDILTTHPYPSRTVGGDVDPYNRLRMTFLPTAQSLYYSGLSGKPSYIQESGTFSETIGSREMSAQFLRINVLSAIANNLKGYQWWCAWEQDHLEMPPYNWAMIERQLGMFDKDYKPKPVAYAMKEMSKLLDKLPEEFPKRKVDGVCVLTRRPEKEKVAVASLIMGKQAGIDLDVAYSDNGDIPESNLYFVPAIAGWQVIYRKTWDTLIEKAKNGATLCISCDFGQMVDFPETVGAVSGGIMDRTSHSGKLGDTEFKYTGKEIFLTPTTAEVLARNEDGNPVILKNKLGKGTVYFVNFAPEKIIFEQPNGFNINPYYKIYREVAKDIIAEKAVYASNENLGVTINPESEKTMLATILNYSDKDIVPEIEIRHGYKIKEVLYGNLDNIPACDGVILRLEK